MAAQRALLVNSPDAAVATAAKAAFSTAHQNLDPVLFEQHKAALGLKGEPARGAVTFQKLCAACHKADGRGAEVGPDLATVRGHTREQILRDIIYPSLTIAPQYHQFVVGTRDGRLITGLLASSSATSYAIRRQGGEEVTVLRMDVDDLREHPGLTDARKAHGRTRGPGCSGPA